MTSFPLVRVKRSNEHVMAELFFILLLYLLPGWIKSPALILNFLAILALGLFIDTAANFIRYKKPVCAVSAAVTSVILDILTPGIPLWGKLIGIIIALIVGKHIWGGTGKNILNPAVTGLLLLSIVFNIQFPIFSSTLLLLPALLLSIRFITFRPYAVLGIAAGMAAALLYKQGLSTGNIVSFGVVFWSCILATDPVTVTPNPYWGFVLGLFSGLTALLFDETLFYMAFGLLLLNIASYTVDTFSIKPYNNSSHFKLKRIIPFISDITPMHDMTTEMNTAVEVISDLKADEILSRIHHCDVFGMGGGAFPAFDKINTVKESDAVYKHLLINGVECDPGLVHDKWLLRQFPDEISKGLKILCRCIDFKSITIAAKDSQGFNYPPEINIHVVPDYYPAGAEKHLIKEVLNLKLSNEDIPAKHGILVLNVQTVYAIYEAVAKNLKANTRYLTLANIKEGTGMVVKAPLDSKVMDIVNTLYPQYSFAFCGGGIMQCHEAMEDEEIGKTTNFIAVSDYPYYKESNLCSKCGFCTDNCPEGLRVNKIAELVDNNNPDSIGHYHPERCLNCGICSFGCPAGRNLSARVKKAKEYIKNN